MCPVSLPQELDHVIMGIVVSQDACAIVDQMRKILVPHRQGTALYTPLSVESSADGAAPVENRTDALPTAIRRVATPMPGVLKPFYEAYPDDVEFRTNDGSYLTLLSEQEMVARSFPGTVDISFRYIGMGHVIVHTYLKGPDLVVSHVDGGANGLDRVHNHRERQEFLDKVASHLADSNALVTTKVARDEMASGWRAVSNFTEWWNHERWKE